MKAKGVYVYGVWVTAYDRGPFWSSDGFSEDKPQKERLRDVHNSLASEATGIKKAIVKRVYIAPPKGKKP